jgi:hypothetical protein
MKGFQMPASAIASALTALKAAKDIAQAMMGLRGGQAFQAKLIEFQSKLIDANSSALAAQEERTALLQTISSLEAEVARLKAWDAEKNRYELKKLERGGFAYLLKPAEANGTPVHAICPNCYERGVKSHLQPNGELQVHNHSWNCPSCPTKVMASRRALDGPVAA